MNQETSTVMYKFVWVTFSIFNEFKDPYSQDSDNTIYL